MRKLNMEEEVTPLTTRQEAFEQMAKISEGKAYPHLTDDELVERLSATLRNEAR